jgi:hypothetical protein
MRTRLDSAGDLLARFIPNSMLLKEKCSSSTNAEGPDAWIARPFSVASFLLKSTFPTRLAPSTKTHCIAIDGRVAFKAHIVQFQSGGQVRRMETRMVRSNGLRGRPTFSTVLIFLPKNIDPTLL